jgi:hypothetical protein
VQTLNCNTLAFVESSLRAAWVAPVTNDALCGIILAVALVHWPGQIKARVARFRAIYGKEEVS